MLQKQKLVPSLWFDDNAEEAAAFYVSIFDDSAILHTARYNEAGPGTPGSVMTVAFQLEGQRFMAINGGPVFTFNEAVSFLIECDSQDEIDYFWYRLTPGGQILQCGWLKDRFGLAWQVSYSHLPAMLTGEEAAANRVMQAMLAMTKIDVAALQRARDGETAA